MNQYKLLAGEVQSLVGLKKLSCQNKNAGKSVALKPTNVWESELPVVEGDNLIRCSAINNIGERVTAELLTSHYQVHPFVTEASISPDIVFAGEKEEVQVLLGLDLSEFEQLTLFEVNFEGVPVKEITNLHDNGASPDVEPNDGVYSAKFNIKQLEPGQKIYRVLVQLNGKSYLSNIMHLRVLPRPTTVQLNDAFNLASTMKSLFSELLKAGDSRMEAASKVKKALMTNPSVTSIDIASDGSLVWTTSFG